MPARDISKLTSSSLACAICSSLNLMCSHDCHMTRLNPSPLQPTAPLYDDTFEKLELDSEGWRQMVYEEIKLFVADPSLYTQTL